MQEITLQSGNKLQIQSPQFKLAMDLIRCMCKELKAQKIRIDPKELSDESNVLELIIDVVFTLIGSVEFDAAFFAIANGCLYNGERINESLFNDRENAREDFFEIEYKIIEACIKPFMKSLLSMLEKAQVLAK